MRLATLVALACLVLAACPASRPGHGPETPTPVDDRPVRIAVARAEARRVDGMQELQDLLKTGDHHAKLLALRGLGRIGGPAGRAILVAMLLDPDVELVAGAMAALGVARELDDTSVEDGAALVPALHAAFARTTGPGKVLAIEALGRAGDQRSQPILVAQLAGSPELAEAAGIALARQGRRKIALGAEHLPKLYAAMQRPEPSVRYAAVYAVARTVPFTAPPPGLAAALIQRLADPGAEVRAQAIAALAKQDLVSIAVSQLEHSLIDKDWRVAVEAVRAMTSDKLGGAWVEPVAVALVRRLSDGDDTNVHVLMEGLRGLQASAAKPVVQFALKEIAQWGAAKSDLGHAWVECLAIAATARAANTLAPVFECSTGRLPDHLRLPLVADLVTANIGTLADRRSALLRLLAHSDVRVRAAAIGALVAPWKEGSEADHASAIGVLAGAIASPDPIFSGAAVDAAAAFYDAIGTGDHAVLDAAVIARAQTEKDAELSAALFDLIGKRKLAAGVEACRAGVAGIPVRAKAARDCLRALGEPAPDAIAAAHAPAPPVDVADVIGKKLRWNLTTTRGEITIDLDPSVAPWAVASIVALTRKGAYDGLAFHRVVPDFVVQGGDPTESGWGGPGYTLPAEPETSADGAGYVVGGVGMADAGRDSAGSQWFVMHARAAHLDGRYTWVGAVVNGQKSADALLIGDKVVKATITAPDL